MVGINRYFNTTGRFRILKLLLLLFCVCVCVCVIFLSLLVPFDYTFKMQKGCLLSSAVQPIYKHMPISAHPVFSHKQRTRLQRNGVLRGKMQIQTYTDCTV
jgi:hypothetical protein